MTIRSVDTVALTLPFEMGGPKPMFGGKPRQMEMLLVRVETEDGLVGWGEAFGFAVWPSTRTALHTLVAPLAVGRDEADIAGIRDELTRKLHLLGRTGPVMFALSGLDIALWDLAGKRAGLPLWKLLAALPAGRGAAAGEGARLPAYASLLRYGDAQRVSVNTARAVAAGYRQVKLHEITVEAVAAARAAAGPGVALMMDCNCPWTGDEALAIAEGVRPHGLAWFEEPVWPPEDFPTLARVRRGCGMPVSAGENAMSAGDFERMFEAGAVDIAQPSVTKIGGVSGFIEVVEAARRHGVRVVAHSPYFGPGLLATLHLTHALLEPGTPIEYSFVDLGDTPLRCATTVEGGTIAVPGQPGRWGLGADPDPATLERCTID
jgi:L-alanine-DL-glutamate epimerase-like enolase superfamily enzyme